MKTSTAKKVVNSPAPETQDVKAAVPVDSPTRSPRPDELEKAIAEEKAKLTRTLDILAKN